MKIKRVPDPTPREIMLCNAGCEEFQLGHLDRAEHLFRNAVRLNPCLYEAWQNLGSTLIESGRLDEGLECARRAVIIAPQRPLAHLAKAVAYRMKGSIDAALDSCLASLQCEPTDDARLLYAHLHLMSGCFNQGWELHERARASGFNPDFAHRIWKGEDSGTGILPESGMGTLPERIGGKRILLLGEQGFGDDLQFIRYAALVKDRGATVIAGAKPQLARIFESVPGVDEVAPFDQPPPDFDVFCPLMRLPYIFDTTEDSIPAQVPYLFPHPEDVEYWEEELKKRTAEQQEERTAEQQNIEYRTEEGLGPGTPSFVGAGFKPARTSFNIGICWKGSARPHDPKANRVDRRRSMSFKDLAPLFSLPGISWHSLQVPQPTPSFKFQVSSFDFVDFADTAAFIANLDLVISVDTAVCHLAGAIGKPVWMLSRFDGCWRWMLDRTDSPWYPTMRIYRQPAPGDWASVVDQVGGDLYQITTRNAA